MFLPLSILSAANRLRDVVADDRRIPPDRPLERPRDDIFLGVAEGIFRRHRLERLRVKHVGSEFEEEPMHISQQLHESGANLVMPVGHGPPTVLESAVAILVLSTRRLHDAVD